MIGVRCLEFAVRCQWFVVCGVLCDVGCLLFIVCCMLFIVCCVSFVVRWSLLFGCCLLCAACCGFVRLCVCVCLFAFRVCLIVCLRVCLLVCLMSAVWFVVRCSLRGAGCRLFVDWCVLTDVCNVLFVVRCLVVVV